MGSRKSLLKLLLMVLGFCSCLTVGVFLYTSTDEELFVPIGFGAGLIVFSVIGFLFEIKNPGFLQFLVPMSVFHA
jgi:hypothetical protein